MKVQILQGDCANVLWRLPADSVQCVVTSPPYWNLRDYGVAGQIGLEESLDEWVSKMVAVFREVRRVLRPDGVCWINLGDSYSGTACASLDDDQARDARKSFRRDGAAMPRSDVRAIGLKPKDLIGQPWMVAFALRADGWWLRDAIVWHKPNPMPESVTDRCTKSYEMVFMLTKSDRYYFNAEAIKEPASENTNPRTSVKAPDGWATHAGSHGSFHKAGREKGKTRKAYANNGVGFGHGTDAQDRNRGRVKNNASFDAAMAVMPDMRNRRNVWTIPTEGYPGAHFATYPTALVRPCILAGSRPGDTVLDPFNGSGTTGQVALELGRSYIGIELNPAYVELTEQRLRGVNLGLPLESTEAA